jgi:hypothetical protein
MKQHVTTVIAAVAFATLGSCNATGDERVYDTTRPDPRAPTLSAPPDSTAGVARSSGRPGVAGDTISRSSKVSPPPGKTPEPRRP